MKIRIKNWDIHQERKERKNYTWFKFYSSFFTDDKSANWSTETKLIWLYVLCERNKTDKELININIRIGAFLTGMSEKLFSKCINELEGYAVLSRHEADTMSSLEKIREDKKEKKEREDICSEVSDDTLEADSRLIALREIFKTRNVKTELQKKWLDAFPDPDWIVSEVRKAIAWEGANPKRRKINFGAFMQNWLARGWDKRRIDPIKKPRGIAEILADEENANGTF